MGKVILPGKVSPSYGTSKTVIETTFVFKKQSGKGNNNIFTFRFVYYLRIASLISTRKILYNQPFDKKIMATLR